VVVEAALDPAEFRLSTQQLLTSMWQVFGRMPGEDNTAQFEPFSLPDRRITVILLERILFATID
jgi:hypothetical protein